MCTIVTVERVCPRRRRLPPRCCFRSPLLNCGIVGGRWRALRPFLAAMSTEIQKHYAARAKAAPVPGSPTDMLPFNELLVFDRRFNHSVVLGHPQGNVNMPMWGDLCWSKEVVRFCDLQRWGYLGCVRHRLAVMSPDYYFTHKLVRCEQRDANRNDYANSSVCLCASDMTRALLSRSALCAMPFVFPPF